MLERHTCNLNFIESRVKKIIIHKQSLDCQCNVVSGNNILTSPLLNNQGEELNGKENPPSSASNYIYFSEDN